MLTYEPIVNYEYRNLSFLSFGPGRQMCAVPCCCMNVHAMKLSANLLIEDAYVVLIIFKPGRQIDLPNFFYLF